MIVLGFRNLIILDLVLFMIKVLIIASFLSLQFVLLSSIFINFFLQSNAQSNISNSSIVAAVLEV